MTYELQIINRLLDKFEGSEQSFNKVEHPKTIRIIVKNDKVFDDYWAKDSYKFRPELDQAVYFLQNKGLVTCEIDNATDLLKYVTLRDDHIDEAFKFAKRKKKSDVLEEENSIIENFFSNAKDFSVLKEYCKKLLDLNSRRESHKSYYSDKDDLSFKCKLIQGIENNSEEILLRNFSKKLFSDSKIVERNASYVLKIFNEFGSEEFTSFSDLCESYGIVKNKGYAYIKNGLRFIINKQEIDLDSLGTEFSLSDEAIEKMEILGISKTKVITIENLTTFHYFNNPEFIVIYLGGYHNSVKRKLIEKIHSFSSSLEWFHFGDIDWGGINIFIDLINKTGIDFKPYLMTIDMLKKYKDECQRLTLNDVHKLKHLLNEDNMFSDLIRYMIDNKVKLEQESISDEFF